VWVVGEGKMCGGNDSVSQAFDFGDSGQLVLPEVGELSKNLGGDVVRDFDFGRIRK